MHLKPSLCHHEKSIHKLLYYYNRFPHTLETNEYLRLHYTCMCTRRFAISFNNFPYNYFIITTKKEASLLLSNAGDRGRTSVHLVKPQRKELRRHAIFNGTLYGTLSNWQCYAEK